MRGKINVKVTPKKKPIKPKMGRGTGGLFTEKILIDIKNKKKS